MFLNNPGHGKITLLLSASMVLIFLGLGCMFFFTDFYEDAVQGPMRKYVAFVLWGWGIFRGVSVVMKYRNLRRDDEEQ